MSKSGQLATLVFVATVFRGAGLSEAAPLLELKIGNQTHVGRSLGHDREVCWLAERDGRVTRVPLQQVTSFRKLDDEFEGLPAVEVRNQLRREFGHGWEIIGAGQFLVCAPTGRGRVFARTFDDVYRSFRSYFSRRGFELPQPQFPLIAVVFPTEQEFAANCARDDVPYGPGLKGYYHRLTNRTSLFESQTDRLASLHTPSTLHAYAELIPGRRLADHLLQFGAETPDATTWDAVIEADLRDTIVHEATHQVAYNLGLHTRIGDNPKWITEGLATMFESDGARTNAGGGRPELRLNRERFERFSQSVGKGHRPGFLADLVAGDRLFQSSPLDAYAQAWALTFFLAETRSPLHSRYLKTLAARDPLKPYTAQERLADFQAAFGNDLNRLEVSWLRFMEDLR